MYCVPNMLINAYCMDKLMICKVCKNDLTIEQFYSIGRHYANGEHIRKTTCKQCNNLEKQKVRILKKANPIRSAICDCCNYNTKLSLDHCHKVPIDVAFRGWLCPSCNLGIALLGDNEVGIQKALSYLNGTTRAVV